MWSYLHALGADGDAGHARAMAMAVLLAASAGFTAGATRLRGTAARSLVAATLGSIGVLIQVPSLSRMLDLRPLHADDWTLVGLAFVATVLPTLVLASRLSRDD